MEEFSRSNFRDNINMTTDDLSVPYVNPVVVICTHERLGITSINIESLLGQCQIVLVVSTYVEAEYYSKYDIKIIIYPNNPLGAKWDRGVMEARKIQPNPLIILGSDDILEPGTVKRYCQDIQKYDFIGLKKWWIHSRGKAYLCEYLADMPLGGGRAYSYSLLSRMNWRIFNPNINKHLDDQGWNNISGRKLLIYDPLIHAIKGNWPVLNPFTLQHKNIKHLETKNSIDILPLLYDKQRIL